MFAIDVVLACCVCARCCCLCSAWLCVLFMLSVLRCVVDVCVFVWLMFDLLIVIVRLCVVVLLDVLSRACACVVLFVCMYCSVVVVACVVCV